MKRRSPLHHTRRWLLPLLLLALCVPAAAQRYHRYRGAIHIHTLYSDGSGTFPAVVEAAQAVGLDYIITSDHNTLEPLRDGRQRYWGKTLVLVGTEISTDDGHVLGLELPPSFHWGTAAPRAPQEAGRPPETRVPIPEEQKLGGQAIIDAVNAAGGFAILAHPMTPRWRWEDWSVRGYTGIEVVNLAGLVENLLSAIHLRLQPQGLMDLVQLVQQYRSSPDRVMRRLTDNPLEPERAKWDELLRRGQQVVGIGAVDAHARVPVRNRVFHVPTYQESFETVQSYVVTLNPLRGELEHDRKAVYSAYRNGRLYVVYPRVAPASQFMFRAEDGEREAIMGQPIPLRGQVRLIVEAPGHPHPLIRLLRNGEEVASAEGERLVWHTRIPGAYRAEVYAAEGKEPLLDIRRGVRVPKVGDLIRQRRQELRAWIFSNPIYVRR